MQGFSDAVRGPINYYRNIAKARPHRGDQKICKPPTLIIWGDRDEFLVKEGASASLKYCQDGKLEYIEGASHWVMQDEPVKVNHLIEEFLASTAEETSTKPSKI
ncbi:unnamed protein product [Nippostrongylus brasiliensis]|uniref:Hydrolase_4 domain-containing protein n=1 Tax=Nippostrongylus brasiliensis TaxID=27835 RepID=A0A0N4XME4_NIPBR|nr:unnamed protein product [Nippostrongylus brasiliensis]